MAFFVQLQSTNMFSYFSMKIYTVLWYSLEAPHLVILTRSHIIHFHGEIRNILCEYPLLSGVVVIPGTDGYCYS